VQLNRLAQRDLVRRAAKLDRKQLRKLLGRAPTQPHHLAVVKRQIEIVVVFGDHDGVVEVDHNSKTFLHRQPTPLSIREAVPARHATNSSGSSAPFSWLHVWQMMVMFVTTFCPCRLSGIM
jgi:hypothetical protein